MLLILSLLITLGLWLLEKFGYAQFTTQEMLYPTYAFIAFFFIQLIIAFITLLFFGRRVNKINIKL